MVIRCPEPHPNEGLDRPTMPAGMTDEAWIMEALLSHNVPRDLHASLDQGALSVTSLLFYTRYRGTAPDFRREFLEINEIERQYLTHAVSVSPSNEVRHHRLP